MNQEPTTQDPTADDALTPEEEQELEQIEKIIGGEQLEESADAEDSDDLGDSDTDDDDMDDDLG
jgi:hypothetical protein